MGRNDNNAQIELNLGGHQTAGDVLARIRSESRDNSEKGLWFEKLFMRLAQQEREFEIDDIHRWPDWPDRHRLTDLDGRDIGIDLVAKRSDGDLIAIQAKCYDDKHVIGKGDIDSFLTASQLAKDGAPVFIHRWVVGTCRWGPTAQRQVDRLQPGVSQIDFREYLHRVVEEKATERPERELLPRQQEAVDAVVAGLTSHNRGRLVMACGTGKTFTALRIAERIVEAGGRILFAAPPSRSSRRPAGNGSATAHGRSTPSSSAPTNPPAGAARTSGARSWSAPSQPTPRESPTSSAAPATRAPCSRRTTPWGG